MSRVTRGGDAGAAVEVEFSIRDSAYPFVAATEREACVFELAKMVPRGDGSYAEFFNVTGVQPDRITEFAAARDTVEVELLREHENGGLFEFLVAEDCPAVTLAEHGALPRKTVSVDGEGRLTAEVPPRHDPAEVIDAFTDEYSDAHLVSKCENASVSSLFTRSTVQQVLQAELTGRQREVLGAAYEAGYYEWPRECTGEDVAETLDITAATFSEHVRAAERKLLTVLFDGGERRPP